MTKEEIQKLAQLARIELTDEEVATFSGDFDEILSYVDQVKEVAGDRGAAPRTPPHRNVLRDDTAPHESGIFTEDLLSQAPSREGAYLSVKKVLKTDE